MRNSKTNELVLTGLFTAIIIIMAFTPLGYIPLVVINATIIHIPVILGSLFCGPKKGAFLGFVFGFTSCLKATIVGGTLSSFVFSPVLAASLVGTSGIFKSLFIAFVPRILVGVIPYFVYIGIKKVLASEKKNLWGTVLNVLMSVFLAFGVYAFLGKMSESLSQAAALGIGIAVGVVVFIVVEAVFITGYSVCICRCSWCHDQYTACNGLNLRALQGCLCRCNRCGRKRGAGRYHRSHQL